MLIVCSIDGCRSLLINTPDSATFYYLTKALYMKKA